LESLEKRMAQEAKNARIGTAKAKERLAVCEALSKHLGDGKPARSFEKSEVASEVIFELALLTAKPIFYCANVGEGDVLTGNAYTEELKKYATERGQDIVVICGKIEEELSSMEAEEKSEFLKDLGMAESGLDKVVHKGYGILGLQTFFTAGEKEVRAWTFHKGWKAPACAGVIHSDFEKGFIRAETLAYSDFEKYGSLNAAKDAGHLRTEGKDYEVRDGDIMLFLFNS